MFHDVIVPLDGTGFAEHALGLSLWIAETSGGRLHLVRVSSEWDAPDEKDSGGDPYLKAMGQRLESDGIEPICQHIFADRAAPAIASYASDVDADLVVIATHGRTGMNRVLHGSVADGVLRHVRQPVLLVRGDLIPVLHGRPVPFHHVLIVVDGSERAATIAPAAMRLGTLAHARYTILYTLSPIPTAAPEGPGTVRDDEDRARQVRSRAEAHLCDVAAGLRTAGLQAEVCLRSSDHPARAILETARYVGADLVAMAVHPSRAPRVLVPSVLDQLLHDSAMPLLALPV
jgi:nucleotide-binding universal stress UspA family protein